MRRTTAGSVNNVAVAVTSTPIVGVNLGRNEITICNDHATQVVDLQFATVETTAPTAVASQGIRLNAAGGSWTSNTYRGAIAGISVGGTSTVTVAEF